MIAFTHVIFIKILFSYKIFLLQIVNLKHVMPTRYTATDITFDKANINKETLKDPRKRRKARDMVKIRLEERYKSGKNRWLFQKLRF